MKAAGMFILKSIVFSVIFWAISAFALLSFYYFNKRVAGPSCSVATTAQTKQNDGDALMQKYRSQLTEADNLQKIYKKQQIQSAAILKKQDELLTRWERIIKRWEKLPAK